MNIAFDMMGGDFAPLEAVKGLQLYLSTALRPAMVFCIGNEKLLKPLLRQYNINDNHILKRLVIAYAMTNYYRLCYT